MRSGVSTIHIEQTRVKFHTARRPPAPATARAAERLPTHSTYIGGREELAFRQLGGRGPSHHSLDLCRQRLGKDDHDCVLGCVCTALVNVELNIKPEHT